MKASLTVTMMIFLIKMNIMATTENIKIIFHKIIVSASLTPQNHIILKLIIMQTKIMESMIKKRQ